jgi:hypothetical protein
MKLELTNPKAWKKLSEKRISMHERIKLYEKIGGAYRLGRNEGEQVYNKLTELLKSVKNEHEYKNVTKTITVDAPEYKDEDVSQSYDVDEPVGKADIKVNTKVRTTPNYTKENKLKKEDEADIKVSKGDIGDVNSSSFSVDGKSFQADESINEMEEMDHEVGMAMGQLDDIIKNATELKGKIGVKEQNLPGWIQDHISQSQNFINQANTGYHELSKDKK